MCLSSPSNIEVTCLKQQSYIIRDGESKRIICTYKTIANAIGNVKTFAYVLEPGMLEHISTQTDVPCLAKSIGESLMFNDIPIDPEEYGLIEYRGLSSVIVNRDDGSVVLGLKLSELQRTNELPKECLKSVFQNNNSEKLQQLLFGCKFDAPKNDDELNTIFQEEPVRDFFDELLEALCGKWVVGSDLLFVIPDVTTESESNKRQRYITPRKSRTDISLVFDFPPEATKFPIMGMQHNHDEGENKENHWFITNIKQLDPKVPRLTLTEKAAYDIADEIANSNNIGVHILDDPLSCYNLKELEGELTSIGW